jgi:hypothetical protein
MQNDGFFVDVILLYSINSSLLSAIVVTGVTPKRTTDTVGTIQCKWRRCVAEE